MAEQSGTMESSFVNNNIRAERERSSRFSQTYFRIIE
jgi:hypothetical protein